MPPPGEDIQSWSTTAATNATADTSINWAEGQPRASVNNSARSMMAAHAKDRNLRNGSITTAGSANAQTFTSGITYTVVPTGLYVRLKIGFTNTSSTTLSMDGITAAPIKNPDGTDIIANSLTLGRYAEFIYDGTNWVLLTPTIYGASFDALSYNGMQVNGSCEVDQLLAGNVSAAGYQHVMDGWHKNDLGVVKVLSSPSSTAPTPPPGFQKFIRLFVTTAVGGTLATGDAAYLTTFIEGYRCSRLGWGAASAQPVSIGFWVQAPIAGTMTVAIRNNAANRSYRADVVISNAATWEYKAITVPGDVTGTWETTNNAGMELIFCFGGGSSFQAAANSWTANSSFATSATTNFLATNSNQMCIVGVVVIPGLQLPTAAQSPNIMRPLDQELTICQRYYEKSYNYATAIGTVTTNGMWEMYVTSGIGAFQAPGPSFKVRKRAAPTVVPYGTNGVAGAVFGVLLNGNAVCNIDSIGETGCNFSITAGAPDLYRAQWVADARL